MQQYDILIIQKSPYAGYPLPAESDNANAHAADSFWSSQQNKPCQV